MIWSYFDQQTIRPPEESLKCPGKANKGTWVQGVRIRLRRLTQTDFVIARLYRSPRETNGGHADSKSPLIIIPTFRWRPLRVRTRPRVRYTDQVQWSGRITAYSRGDCEHVCTR
jgi:hypothetical protein